MSAHLAPGVHFRRDGSVRLVLLVLAVLAAATGAVYGRGQRSAEDPEGPAAAFGQPPGEASARFAGLVVDSAGMPIADVYVAMCASALLAGTHRCRRPFPVRGASGWNGTHSTYAATR